MGINLEVSGGWLGLDLGFLGTVVSSLLPGYRSIANRATFENFISAFHKVCPFTRRVFFKYDLLL